MTKSENRQRIKNEALNKIAKMYYKDNYKGDLYDERNYGEQRDDDVKWVLDDMNRRLKEI
jgi:hypothetical protein